ncbi:sterol-sensing domain [Anaeramoeba flamelloides]|uniref:Sterol-sensing domain n=1 Tax=Anaeramoeba flamelloides TaxID=1746091 RepID=A0ABQ8YML2_9EUKA|nr:sterol-sensing domain [Anaeramoeba flamelloides]
MKDKSKNKKKQANEHKNLHFIPVYIVDHPKTVMFVSMSIAVLMTALCFAWEFKYDSKMSTFVVRSGKTANQIEAILMAIEEETYFDKDTYDSLQQKQPGQSQLYGGVNLIYECLDCDNLLTEKYLKKIYDFEEKIIGNKFWKDYEYIDTNGVAPSRNSIIPFYFDDDGEFLQDVSISSTYLYNYGNGTIKNTLCDINFNDETLKSKYLKTILLFGLPLENYKNMDDNQDEQVDKLENWLTSIIPQQSEDFKTDSFEVLYQGVGVTDYGVNQLLIHDISLIVCSLFLVFGYTLFHTKSLFLTSLGTLHSVISLPMSYFFYKAVLGVEVFSMLNFLTLFIILGIGCDDIFIMLDAWKQSQFQKKEISKNIYTRMNWAYSRAAMTMLITTLTSTGAFFGNIASTIPPIRFFGVFTGIAIIFNYIMVVTWFPAVIVIWHLRGEDRPVCNPKRKEKFKQKFGKKKSKSKNTKTKDPNNKENNEWVDIEDREFKKDVDHQIQKQKREKDEQKNKKYNKEAKKLGFQLGSLRKLEKYFFSTHANFIKKYRWTIVLFFVIWSVFFIYYATKLEAAEDTRKMLPDDSFLQRCGSISIQEFYSNDLVNSVYLQWGIESIDREGVDPMAVDYYGKPIWDKKWKPNLKSSQEWVLEVCSRVKTEFEEEIYRTGQFSCFMEDFRDWVTNETLAGGAYTFPVEEDQFQKLLGDFTNSYRSQLDNSQTGNEWAPLPMRYDWSIGFGRNSDELKYYAIQFNLALSPESSAHQSRIVFDKIEDFIKELNEEAPEGINTLSNVSWQWMEMLVEEILYSVALTSVVISLIIAFIIILVTSDNIIASLYAIISIGGVVATIMGMLVLLDWNLGLIESICITIVVGISVDYVVHFCHGYITAPPEDVFSKMKISLTNLGISVVSAAITTLCASFVMLFTWLIMFKRFGLFIWMTIVASCLWSFFFFFALIIIQGPVRNQGRIGIVFQKIFCNKRYKMNQKKKKQNAQNSTDSSELSSIQNSNIEKNIDESKFYDIELSLGVIDPKETSNKGKIEKVKKIKKKNNAPYSNLSISTSSATSNSNSD